MNSILPDVQSTHDTRNIFINRVGIRDVSLPIDVLTSEGTLSTVAHFSMTVALPADQKGTHMSRFVALLNAHHEAYSAEVVRQLMAEMLVSLESSSGTIEISFPYFVKKIAPVSKLESIMNYEASWIANAEDNVISVTQKTLVPVTSLCPCSKEISRFGAHNQRSHVTTAVTVTKPFSLEEQIRVSEAAASCELWARLKRSDEKFVTEYAYEHPKFVEDLVRDIAKSFNNDERIDQYHIEAENFESIHNHSAYAVIDHKKSF